MRSFARVALIAMSLLVSIVAVELLTRVYLKFLASQFASIGGDEIPRLYQDADYYSDRFWDEYMRAGPVIRSPSLPYFLIEDFTGEHINIADGMRVTTNAPTRASRRILVFGGSTILSLEVPDQYTIPSFLQRLLNARCDDPPVALNYGVASMNSSQQLARLRSIEVRPGDVVIFYDGVNEILYTVFEGSGGFATDSPGPVFWRLSTWRNRLHWLADRWRDTSAFLGIVANRMDHRMPNTITNPAVFTRNLAIARSSYRDNMVAAHNLVSNAHARFFHFLQPHLFTTPLSTAYRQRTAHDTRLTPAGLEAALRHGYPELMRAMNDAMEHGVQSVDLTEALDARALHREVFFDFVHLNEVGNEVIAGAIYTSIAESIGCSLSPEP